MNETYVYGETSRFKLTLATFVGLLGGLEGLEGFSLTFSCNVKKLY